MIAPQNAGQKPVMWNGSDSLPATQLVSHSSSALTIYGGPLRLALVRRIVENPQGRLHPPDRYEAIARLHNNSLLAGRGHSRRGCPDRPDLHDRQPA